MSMTFSFVHFFFSPKKRLQIKHPACYICKEHDRQMRGLGIHVLARRTWKV